MRRIGEIFARPVPARGLALHERPPLQRQGRTLNVFHQQKKG